jgi:hypothetical protein
MILRMLIIIGVCMSSSGCFAILRQQTPAPDVCSLPPEKKSDMVWVEAKTSKIWVNPQLDDNGDMIEGHYRYTVLTPGHWDVAKGNQP